MFFLEFLWWSDCYIFNRWYIFLIVTGILRNKTFCLNICFIPILPTLRRELPFPIMNFLNFFSGDGTPTHPLKILKNIPVVIADNFQR